MAKSTSPSKNAGAAAPAKKSSTKPAALPAMPGEDNTLAPGLMDLFVSELKDLYWAENQLVKALPKMQQAATAGKLKDAIATHWKQTQTHVARLEQIFDLIGKKAQAKKCDAMEGLTKEGEGVIEDTAAGTATRDAGIIIASQKVEHYEIAAYGGLAQLARTLGLTDAADILTQTLGEEKDADMLLTDIAENDINYQAAGNKK